MKPNHEQPFSLTAEKIHNMHAEEVIARADLEATQKAAHEAREKYALCFLPILTELIARESDGHVNRTPIMTLLGEQGFLPSPQLADDILAMGVKGNIIEATLEQIGGETKYKPTKKYCNLNFALFAGGMF